MDNKKLLQVCESLGVLKQLDSRGYIKREGEEVVFTDKALQLVEKKKIKLTASSISVEEWIDEYRNLFPRGVVSGGYPVRGDKRSCIKKMQKFMAQYPEFDKDIILTATRNYISRKEMEGFKFMKLAHYFIVKDNVSSLAAECEMIIESELNSDKNGTFEEGM